MKKLFASIIVCVLLLSGCADYTQEEVDSMVSEAAATASSEAYESGRSVGYTEGYDNAVSDYSQPEEEYSPTEIEEAYGEGYSDGCQDAYDEYAGYIEFNGELISEEEFIHYYSVLCDYYGLPEYYEGWNEEDWETEEYVTDNSVSSNSVEEPQEAIVYWTPNGGSYHSTEYCRTLSRSKNILSGTIDEAVASGHGDPCNVCN